MAVGIVLLVSVATFGSLIFWNSRPDFQVLFSNLSAEDAGEIASKLKEKKIPFELSYNGSTVLVAKEQVYDLRLSFVNEGLPKGGGIGFEVFDRTSLGTTDFVQKLNYQRALQGELSRTIKQIKEVEQARVHIVAPKESLFVEDQKKASASVFIKTRVRDDPGRDSGGRDRASHRKRGGRAGARPHHRGGHDGKGPLQKNRFEPRSGN